MRFDFEAIVDTQLVNGNLEVRWKEGNAQIYRGKEHDEFMKKYRTWLAQQPEPKDRICDLDRYDENGMYSRDVENANLRAVMNTEEREKFERMERDFDGVFKLINNVTTLQDQSQKYVDKIIVFQRETVKILQESQSFLMRPEVKKWELKRMESLVKKTTECREIAKQINAIALQIMEDWII